MNVKGLLIGSAIVIAGAAQANLVVNGDFENQPNFGINGDAGFTMLTGSQMPGWTIEPGRGATVHKAAVFYPTISGLYSINTDGEGLGGGNANFYQDIATTIGSFYQLDYDYQGWTNSSNAHLDITVFDNDSNSLLHGGNFPFDPALHHITSTFLATGSSVRLRVKENPESGFNDNQFMVDNFSFVETVPEPGSFLALGAGLAMLIRRRKK